MSATAALVGFLIVGIGGLFVGAYGAYAGAQLEFKGKLGKEYERGFAEAITSEPAPATETLKKGAEIYTMADLRKAEKAAHKDGWNEAEDNLREILTEEVAAHAEDILTRGFHFGVQYAQTGELPDELKQMGL